MFKENKVKASKLCLAASNRLWGVGLRLITTYTHHVKSWFTVIGKCGHQMQEIDIL